jgi:MYXO-CTERM domain-containing protein
MSLANRVVWTALALAPAVVTTEGPALAQDSASSTVARPLPHGVHRGKNGRYYQDACDRDRRVHCKAHRLLPATYRPGDSLDHAFGSGGGSTTPPQGSMGPSDVLAAYSLASVPSRGGIVAIEDFPDSTALNDVNVYRKAYGIPPLPACAGAPSATGTPCFAVYDENGTPNPTGLQDGAQADGETSFDMDMISAGCPDCSILLIVWTGSTQAEPTDADFQAGAATAAALGANAVSISYGGFESTNDPATGYTVPGKMPVFVASGDDGYDLENDQNGGGGGGAQQLTPDYPASSPDVLGVGGTLLQAGSGGSYSEVVWNANGQATTSGCSTEFPMPAYQTAFGAAKFGKCTMRATNDLAAAADFAPADGNGGGIAMYISSGQQPGFQPWVGTSASAPLMAAIMTRLGLTAQIASDFGFVYKNIAAFNDVTSGTDDMNSQCTDAIMCKAAAGWDGPTGVGTPNGAKLALTLGSIGGGSGGGDAGSDAGTGGGASGGSSSGSGSGSSSGGAPGSSGSSGGGIAIDDGGVVSVQEDGGASSAGGGAAAAGGGGAAGGGSGAGAGGCGCVALGAASAANDETGMAALLLGALALIGARRRR